VGRYSSPITFSEGLSLHYSRVSPAKQEKKALHPREIPTICPRKTWIEGKQAWLSGPISSSIEEKMDANFGRTSFERDFALSSLPWRNG